MNELRPLRAAAGRLRGTAGQPGQAATGGPEGQPWDHAARCAWLRRQAAYDAGPYEQAARVFRRHGYTDGAKAILIAQHRHARQAITGPLAWPRRILDIGYDLTVGYGYRPGRALWLLAVLLILQAVTMVWVAKDDCPKK